MRHPLNVPGDFYVTNDCCISCLVPFEKAPEHLFYNEEAMHCYVCRQPDTELEQERMVQAIHAADLGCIRYAGNEPYVLNRLTEIRQPDQSDVNSQKIYPWEKPSRGLLEIVTKLWQRFRHK
jgi:hypothetical protein